MAEVLWNSFASLRNAFSWIPYLSERSLPAPRWVKLPDLLAALPNSACEFRISALCKEVSDASSEWACQLGLPIIHGDKTSSVGGIGTDGRSDAGTSSAESVGNGNRETDLKAGLLAAMCFPTADRAQLRLCADFLNWILFIELRLATLERMDAKELIQEIISFVDTKEYSKDTVTGFAKGLQSVLDRLESSPEAPFVFERFIQALLSYLQLLARHITEHSEGRILSTNMYIYQLREQGWIALLFILIEYSQGLKFTRKSMPPNAIREAAGDIIIYALGIYARVGRRSIFTTPPTPNIISLLEFERSLTLQSAIDSAGTSCATRAREMAELQSAVPSKGASKTRSSPSGANSDIALYVRGLGDCVRGVLHWGFESERYFGREGAFVRMTMLVETAGTGAGHP